MNCSDVLKHDDKFRYMLLSRMKSDCDYYLGNGSRHAKHLWAGDEVKQIVYMKALWNSFGENDKPEWLTYEQILEYEEKIGIPAILVEMDYKGYYERFALTPEEFEKEFPETFKRFAPIEVENSDTIKSLVHIWFEPCVVGDDAWECHFTDMARGLPESDIAAGNLAYVDYNQVQSLEKYINGTVYPYLSQCSDFEIIKEHFSEENLERIEESIRLYDETDLLVVNEETGELYHKNGKMFFKDAVSWYAGLIETKDFVANFGDVLVSLDEKISEAKREEIGQDCSAVNDKDFEQER